MTEKAVKFGKFMSKMLCHDFYDPPVLNINSGKMVEIHSGRAPKIGKNAHTCPDILATPEAIFAPIYMRFFLLESL